MGPRVAFQRVTFIVFTMVFILVQGIAAAQTIELGSTPEAPQEQAQPPKFFIAAVGDFPDGYFRDVVIEPGGTVELTVAVVNSGEVPADLLVYKINAISGINGGFIAGEETSQPVMATQWIDLDPFEVSLEPEQQHLQTFSVSVPPGTPPGQYMSGLLVRTARPVDVPGSTIFSQTLEYTISISIVVPGEVGVSFELGDPIVTARDSERRIAVPIGNTGNYLVRPAGELVLSDLEANVVHRSRVEMGSVYMGTSTEIWVSLPGQMPAGSYVLDLVLVDPVSGASDSIESFEVSVPKLNDGTGIYVESVSIAPNDASIVYANVDITLTNGGQQIPSTNVTLQVIYAGKVVEEFPLASNQVMLAGTNEYSTRYIPEGKWESGEYSFRIKVESVDPTTSEGTTLLDEDLPAELIVP